ncbi:molybdopterin-dependent oxidoreductase [Aeromicrobium sp. IC_218]|uniref:molybdopterin-dependent oxidoreductase n=1 Tax=Aeromicrobium sp. IC_218 TaxID=2545468 RepID=UPI00103A97AF|nr:molybdopterin-dependent oxidoreductase [Aeromicrobium sp. IC_218]TCI97724.1 molybdopterin-binding oxidoreductase [Aeromicrobium sp. IC_218]
MNITTVRLSAVAAALGVLAAGAGVLAGTGVAALTNGPSPLVAVGNAVIERTPGPLKDYAIRTFGENDKTVLLAGAAVVLALIAAVAGVIGLRHRRVALGIVVVVGLLALAATLTDGTTAASRALTLLAPIATLVVAVVSLDLLLRRTAPLAEAVRVPASRDGDDVRAGFDRRAFVLTVLGTAAVGVVGGVITRVAGGARAAASRAGIKIPKPADAAGPLPSGLDPVDGISPYLTPNRDFYRVDTALTVPDVPADTWRLRIHGAVDNELDLDFADLLSQRLVERRITLTCVSNEVGGPYVGNATWIGVPLADLLEQAGVKAGADALKSTSADGMVIGTPLEAVTDGRDALVAVAMNGEPLPLEHGFPARMVVPGLYGYVSATKWLVDIEVTRFADFTAYWTEREWDEQAPIKLSSRIDVPRAFEQVPRDRVVAGGVAWAQGVGIATVEVSVDDGPWERARLAPQDTVDTWRQWSWRWSDATPGAHTISVRTTDADGNTQTSDRVPPRPNGSTGRHSVRFTVE